MDCLSQSIASRLSLDPGSFVLYCGSKQIVGTKSFDAYKDVLTNNCTLSMSLSLPGGAERRVAFPMRTTNFSRQVDRIVPRDVNRSEEACMRCGQRGSAVKMPCGHSMCPACIVRYALSEVVDGSNQTKIVCYGLNCEQVWTPGVIKRFSGASDEEMAEITTKLSQNFFIESEEVLRCPNCQSYCKRADSSRLSAKCENCAAKGRKVNPWFCWRCKKPWIGSVTAGQCRNEDCRTSTVTIGRELGHGAFGKVYESTKDGQKIVAKKVHEILEQAGSLDKSVQSFKSEAMMMSKNKHPNIVQCLGMDKIEGKYYLLMEFMTGSLHDYIDRVKGGRHDPKFPVTCSQQVANGLKFLHAQKPPVVHRDLSSKNILIAPDKSIKIGDFGMAKVRHADLQYLNTKSPGATPYMPPEALSDDPQYTEKLDIFSLGVVMLEVETLEHPTLSLTGIGVTPEVERRHSFLVKVTDANPLKAIIIRCLCNFYKDRPTAVEVHTLLLDLR